MAIKFTSQVIPAKKSTAVRKERAEEVGGLQTAQIPNGAATDDRLKPRKAKQQVKSEVDHRTQALPVDTPHKPKIGRPKTDFDRTEYQKLYMRDKATIKRLGLNCTVKQYRESLK